jgi:hypothetical protein
MFGKKGQGAMEYLMTYGWAILVVMIVGIVMWQLGIFNLGSTSVTSSGFPKIKPQLTSCKMSTAGAFSCLFTNGAGSGITINMISATAGVGGTCATTLPAINSKVAVGDNFQVSATGCKTGAVGDPYTATLYISYTVTVAGTDVTHNDTGLVRGPYENA